MGNCKINAAVLSFILQVVSGTSYFVTLSSNAPVVVGANVTFKAELYNSYGNPPSGTFRFPWHDNAIPSHMGLVEGVGTVAQWNVSYPPPYAPGQYEMEVIVEKSYFGFYHKETSQRLNFNITALLNGKIEVEQHSNNVMNKFVSNAEQVTHLIELSGPDHAFVSENSTSALTYWFVDCIYYGYSTNYTFFFNYTESRVYNIEALVVISYEKPVTTTIAPPTSTTTASPPTPGRNITSDATSSTTSATTLAPPNVTNTISPTKETTTPPPVASVNGLFDRNISVRLPYVCPNSTSIAPDHHKTYGYFRKQVTVKAPISKVEVTGNNWLQPGDMLDLMVSCNGSSNFYHCLKIRPGIYNATGNETCVSELPSAACRIPLKHYFREPATYTYVVIIRNDVSKVVKSITVNMYIVTKQPQLSVIVVPVACSLMAVILIVFGVAYYVQSRNRYTVEVADFDFGQVNDMEYKTFHERLRDGMSNVFNRTNEFSEPEPPRRKYDNME